MPLAVLTAAFMLLPFAAGCGGGKVKEETTDIDEIWGEIDQANRNINSVHREIAIYYENTKYGGGPVQSMITDSNGEDVHEQILLFGQVVSETIYVNGRQYDKDIETNKWKETPVTPLDEISDEYTPQLLDQLSEASSKVNMGAETIGDTLTEHWRFSLGPEFAMAMFTSMPSSDFSQNTGSEVNLWIGDGSYYIIKCEMVIRNVLITNEIGDGDLRFVLNFSEINEPIVISPPI